MNTDCRINSRSIQQRHVPLEKLSNLRELGGYPVTDSGGRKKQIKWGLLYRSGGGAISAKDTQCLEGLKLKTIVDFRAGEEKEELLVKPSAGGFGQLATVSKQVELPINVGNLMGVLSDSGEWVYNSTADGAVAEMKKLYSALPAEAILQYRELFSLLSDPSNAPLLFHCSAGKDRTGLASALLLHALGANRETIMEDYLASAEYLRKYYIPYLETRPHIVPYMTVREEYLLTAWAEIEKYGGADRYISHELKADTEHLRSLYTG
jgi:protein-tyrosine phosphatase